MTRGLLGDLACGSVFSDNLRRRDGAPPTPTPPVPSGGAWGLQGSSGCDWLVQKQPRSSIIATKMKPLLYRALFRSLSWLLLKG